MNSKVFVSICALFFICALAYWLNDILTVSAWATYDGKQWHITATNWQILKGAWPITLSSLIITVPISFIATYYILHIANKSDQNQKFKLLTQEADAAKQEAQTANQRAEQQYKDRYEQLNQKEQEVDQLKQNIEAWIKEQQGRIQKAKEEAQAANKRADKAEKRKTNAAAAAERRRQRIERLKNKKQTT